MGCDFIAIIPADAVQDVDNYTHILVKPAFCIVITNITMIDYANSTDKKTDVLITNTSVFKLALSIKNH